MHYIEKEVNRLVKKHKTRDPFELCHLENINVLFDDFPSELNGMYQYYERNRTAYINKNLSKNKQYFTCAHELGHAVIHKKVNCLFLKQHTYLNTNKLEKEANLFVAFLKIPEIKADMFHEKTLEEVACELEVPKELLELRVSVARYGGEF